MDPTALIIRRTIIRYRALLANETDKVTRKRLRRLIADCETELPRLIRLSLR